MIKTHVVVFFINRLIFTIGKQRVVLVPAADGELERVGRFGFGQRQWRLQRPLTAQIPREACLPKHYIDGAVLLHFCTAHCWRVPFNNAISPYLPTHISTSQKKSSQQ